MKSTKLFFAELAVLSLLVLSAVALVYHVADREKMPAVGAFNPTGGSTYLLQSSISSTQTSITLTSFVEPGSNIPYTMTYLNSNIEYGTIAPSSGNSEFISFSGITQNTNGTATLTGVIRGLSRSPGNAGCVASSTLASGYPGQTQFILSNSPCFYSQYAVKQNNETILGAWTYSSTSPPRYDNVGAQATGTYIATTSEFASIAYVNAISFAGTANATQSVKGIAQLATGLQAASSTVTGSTGANLVIPTSIATSSNDVPGLHAVITQNSGKINWNQIDLGTAFTATALDIFNKGITSNATTTIAASSTTSNALNLNGLNYAFPSLYGASSSVLILGPSGTLSWGAFQNLQYATTSGGFTGPATSTFSIPSGVLTASSTVTAQGVFTCTTNGGCTMNFDDNSGDILATFNMNPNNTGATYSFPFFITITSNGLNSQMTLMTGTSLLGTAGATPSSQNIEKNTSINFGALTGFEFTLSNSGASIPNYNIIVRP